jgi:2-polyprenyl-6-methoxyphenol hydroxylase-like FAD-dependent oxidoreductase
MKAVIGGGIAGLTMGLLLKKKTGMLLSARSASMVNKDMHFDEC